MVLKKAEREENDSVFKNNVLTEISEANSSLCKVKLDHSTIYSYVDTHGHFWQ